ncbi:hypothetical protein BDC45DRAFT_542797, partial [Circinella umbellata]
MNSFLRSTLDKHLRSPSPPMNVDSQSRTKSARTEAANSLVGLANNKSNVDNITQLFRQVSFHEGTSLNQHDSLAENNEDDTPNAADNGRSVQFDSDGDVEMMSDTSQRSNSPPKKKWGRYNPPELKTIEKVLEAMVGDSNSAASDEEIYDNFQKNFKSANIGQDKLKAYVQKNFRVTLRHLIKPFG